MSLFHFSIRFEHHMLIVRRAKLYYTTSGIITPIGGRPVHGTYSHKTQRLYIISSDIYYTTTCFGPVCRPSSGCPENLSDYTLRVVPCCGGGRDLALQHESWKLVKIEINILRGYINCTHLIILTCRLSIKTITLRCCINR